jgi:hypothetical protein
MVRGVAMGEERIEGQATGPSGAEGARDLIRRAAKILEPRMRLVYFTERVRDLPDDGSVEALRELVIAAAERDPGALALLNDLGQGDVLSEILGPEKVSRVYHGARRAGWEEVVRLLSRPRAVKEYDQGDDLASMYALSDRTIGERRFLARSRDVEALDRLTYDLDPLVIRELLGNPMVTEKHVMKIAARRPCTRAVLAEIARHPRWVAREGVREALVRNPYIDPRLALSLVTTMLRRELKEIARDAEVHPEVRRQARELLDRRRGRKGEQSADER